MPFTTLLRISRPRFWHYILGPMLIYFASSGFLTQIQESISRGGTDRIFSTIFIIIVLGYFTFPANLWIYGRNDIADGDTDKFNDKKGKYEVKIEDTDVMKRKLKKSIWMWNIGYIIISQTIVILFIGFTMGDWTGISEFRLLSLGLVFYRLLPFFLTSYLYSCKPLRAKAKPFLDGMMNILYVATPFSIIIGFIIANGPISSYTRAGILPLLFAAWCWVIAMHCYSAIPDIEPDKKAGLVTTAVYLGKQKSLLYCGGLYLLSAVFSFPLLGWFSILGGGVYLTMIILSYTRKDIFGLYKLFPYINLLVGFLLFRYIIL